MRVATPGFGSAAIAIDRVTRQSHSELRKSESLGNRSALDELDEVWDACRRPDWDGHGALAVTARTRAATLLLLDSLPYAFPLPSIGAEPDGQIALEWRKGPSRVLSVSVDPAGYLHFAGIFGLRKQYGTLPFFGTAPVELLELVRGL